MRNLELPDGLAKSVIDDPPPPSWESRCNMCRLFVERREAYDWLTEALVSAVLTQEEIVAELASRWGIKAAIAQLSRHRTKHLLPDLKEVFELRQAAQTVAAEMGAKTPEEIREAVSMAAIVRLQQEIAAFNGDKDFAAGLSSLMGALNAMLDNIVDTSGAGARVAQEIAELRRDNLALQKALSEGKLEELLYQYITDTRPDLLPQLAAKPTASTADEEPESEATV